MSERTATVASRVGLHARPAAIFAEAAGEYENLEITIRADGEDAEEGMDASSVLSLMSLGAAHGDLHHRAGGEVDRDQQQPESREGEADQQRHPDHRQR